MWLQAKPHKTARSKASFSTSSTSLSKPTTPQAHKRIPHPHLIPSLPSAINPGQRAPRKILLKLPNSNQRRFQMLNTQFLISFPRQRRSGLARILNLSPIDNIVLKDIEIFFHVQVQIFFGEAEKEIFPELAANCY